MIKLVVVKMIRRTSGNLKIKLHGRFAELLASLPDQYKLLSDTVMAGLRWALTFIIQNSKHLSLSKNTMKQLNAPTLH